MSTNQAPNSGTACLPERLYVPPAQLWIHATDGRIAPDAFSWMQAVHWVAGSGLYTPTRGHGPRAWCETTTAIAREISALTECRPGVDYLARKLRISERTVKYHLGMLREAGLLVYRSKGTRLRGGGNQASVFERIIPTAFDTALGIRTVGEGVQRRIVGAAPEHRKTLGRLAKKAARKVTRRRHRTPSQAPSSGRSRCTPMEGSSTGTSPAGSSHQPSESKLASGQQESTTEKSSTSTRRRGRKTRSLNRVGRRYQLAAELIAQVPWLARANRARIAWIVREVADAGWTAREVQAVAESTPLPQRGVLRPSGMLADRLRGKADMPQWQREANVAMWEESRHAEQARHADFGDVMASAGPVGAEAKRALAEAFEEIARRKAAHTNPVPAPVADDVEEWPMTVDELSADTLREIREEAALNPDIITGFLDLGASEADARRLYGDRLVTQAITLARLNARTLAPAF